MAYITVFFSSFSDVRHRPLFGHFNPFKGNGHISRGGSYVTNVTSLVHRSLLYKERFCFHGENSFILEKTSFFFFFSKVACCTER